jgi:hypothetical protein
MEAHFRARDVEGYVANRIQQYHGKFFTEKAISRLLDSFNSSDARFYLHLKTIPDTRMAWDSIRGAVSILVDSLWEMRDWLLQTQAKLSDVSKTSLLANINMSLIPHVGQIIGSLE